MKTSVALTGLLAALAQSKPIDRRGVTDATILNYALTLEHLEDKFYREGLSRFSEADFAAAGYDSTFYNNIKEVSLDETTHVQFLTSALTAAGYPATAECVYDFGVTDVASFIATAAVLEGVGVSAYLGAAASIANKQYLTAAGSILTVEARHSSYLRAGLKELPFAQPFDAPLDLDEVYSLAAPFIKSCPASNPKLPVKAFPQLTVSSQSKPIVAGSKITVKSSKLSWHGKAYAAFVTVTGPIFVPAYPVYGGYDVTVPKGVNGQSYVILNNCNTALTDETTLAIGIVEIDNPTFIPA